MHQSTAPTSSHPGTPRPDLEDAIARIRAAAAQPTPLPDSVRFNLETARELARRAPGLYEMGAGTRGRFTLIATFIDDALNLLDPQQPATTPIPAPRTTTTPRAGIARSSVPVTSCPDDTDIPCDACTPKEDR